MSLSIDIKGAGEVRAALERMKRGLLTPELINGLADEAKRMVLERTSLGFDHEGRRFRPYSKAYGEERRKKGRGADRVDLRMEGHMLGDIRTRVDTSKMKGFVHFQRAVERKKALYHNEAGVGKKRVKREFFRLSRENLSKLDKIIDGHIEKVLNRA
jgi:hypothetical protein